MSKRIKLVLILLLVSLLLISCDIAELFETPPNDKKPLDNDESYSEEFSSFDQNTTYDLSTVTKVRYFLDELVYEGTGVKAKGTTLTIEKAGEYMIFGENYDGKIIIDAPDDAKIHILLNDLILHSKSSSVIYINNADKVVITLVDGSQNILSDAESYTYSLGEDAHNGCIYSNIDLTINGYGELKINGNIKNGITCKKDFKMLNSSLTIDAANNGIKSDKSILIKSGTININAGNNGLKASDNSLKNGYIIILSGIHNIASQDYALEADKLIKIASGQINVSSYNGQPIRSEKQEILVGCLNIRNQ